METKYFIPIGRISKGNRCLSLDVVCLWIYTTWPSFPFACRPLFIVSTHKLVAPWVSGNFLSLRIFWAVFICSFFYFEKFSTWIWRLPYTWSFKNSAIDRCYSLKNNKQRHECMNAFRPNKDVNLVVLKRMIAKNSKSLPTKR